MAPHLGAPEMQLAGFHVYTFNQLGDTERWRQEAIEQLGRTAAA
ncbi:MAG: hypothetical protein ACRDN6_11205 [Gaiellaceae bacterium]